MPCSITNFNKFLSLIFHTNTLMINTGLKKVNVRDIINLQIYHSLFSLILLNFYCFFRCCILLSLVFFLLLQTCYICFKKKKELHEKKILFCLWIFSFTLISSFKNMFYLFIYFLIICIMRIKFCDGHIILVFNMKTTFPYL